MPEIGKYGSLRRNFLRENAPMVFDEMLLEGTLYPHLAGDGQRSTPANRADDADADAAEHRPEPADRPDGLDAVDERLAEPSRGTGDAADLQPVIQEPQAESDTTPSAFFCTHF